jgi:hypothetical protein
MTSFEAHIIHENGAWRVQPRSEKAHKPDLPTDHPPTDRRSVYLAQIDPEIVPSRPKSEILFEPFLVSLFLFLVPPVVYPAGDFNFLRRRIEDTQV